MLLQQRAFTEPARALAVFMGLQIDKQYHHGDEAQRAEATDFMALLTPVAKAFFTDKGYEACNNGLQVLGGHGFVREWGLEQLVRDCKIAQIYEGTNGIQAQDYLVRKVCLDKTGLLEGLYQLIEQEIEIEANSDEAKALKAALIIELNIYKSTTDWLKSNFRKRAYELQGCAVDYLHATGHLIYGWMWLKMLNSLQDNKDPVFIARKLLAATYYTRHNLPDVSRLCDKVQSGYVEIMNADSELI